MAEDESPRNADFIGRVVSDAKSPPETRLLTGWLGDAADESHRRLYTDAELQGYVDIPEEAILHTEAMRDVQPAGGVFVWVRRDAALKQGGSAASRAARFLQGQVQQDYASGGQAFRSPEEAGFRCITQVPCGEPTGFTGQCTKQPEVGGAWPCITAIPHCAEPTGFTGQCTHQPWPNPTRYIGCTFIHCPTQDLTHVPHICNIVATGLPGCPMVDPRGGAGDPVEGTKDGGGDQAAAAPATALLGCGYTKQWGLCETHLLGCGFTRPPRCTVSVNIPCITQDLACSTANAFAARVAGQRPVTENTCFGAANAARQPVTDPSIVGACNPSAVDACPTRIGCETQPPTSFCTQFPEACRTEPPFCGETDCGPRCQTQQQGCTQMACTQAGPGCHTYPNGDCTFFGCQPTPATICTQSGPQCPSQFGSGCPTDTATDCTLGCTQIGAACPSINFDCQQSLIQRCPNQPRAVAFAAHPGAAGAAQAAGGGVDIALTRPWLCQMPTPATRCFICPPPHQSRLPWLCPQPSPWCAPSPFCPPITRTFHCGGGASAVDACPTRLCAAGGFQQRAAGTGQEPTPATVCFVCTQVPWLCPVAY